MSITVTGVANTQTFGNWLELSNIMAGLFSSNTVTVDSSANGSPTSGNAAITGILSSTTIATSTLRGGNVQSSANLTISSNAVFSSPVYLGNNAVISAGSLASGNTSAKVLDEFSRTVFRTAKYTVSIKDEVATGFQSSEILVVHDDATAFVTEYAQLITASTLGQFTATLQPNNQVQLIYTPVSANTTVKFTRTATTV